MTLNVKCILPYQTLPKHSMTSSGKPSTKMLLKVSNIWLACKMRTGFCTCATLFSLSSRKWVSMSSNRVLHWSRSSIFITKRTLFMLQSWNVARDTAVLLKFLRKFTCLKTPKLPSLILWLLCKNTVPCANVFASPCTKFTITLCITECVKHVTCFSRHRWPLWLSSLNRQLTIRFCTIELWSKLA